MTEAEGESAFGGGVDPVDEQSPVGEPPEAPEPVVAESQVVHEAPAVEDEPVAVEAPAAADPSMPAPPETGEPRVDEAVGPLRDLGGRPTEEHVSAYDQAHSGLQDVLADLDRDTDGPR
ncbi:MAG: hypothetical protein GEV10_26960 [Streptosporangiales bacterium]|nr:hypothetical protein [Streptosporangiales bacterium]